MSTIYRSPLLKKNQDLVSTPFPKIHTLTGCFARAVKKYSKQPCMGWREVLKVHHENGLQTVEYKEKVGVMNYQQVGRKMERFGSGLARLTGLKSGDTVGIYGETSKEWMIGAHGCFQHSLTVVTCYANLGIEALVHVINETGLQAIIVDPVAVEILETLKHQIPTLKYVIVIAKEAPSSSHFEVVTFNHVVEMGKKKKQKPKPPKPDTVAVIMYTSGSTGMPKGVVVLHKQLVASAASMTFAIGALKSDVYLGYLPLAHILELAAEHACLFSGSQIGYGNPRTLTAKVGGAKNKGDIEVFRPTVLAGVPRVWDTIKKGIMMKISNESTVKQWMFNAAYKSQQSTLNSSGQLGNGIWNWLVFSKLQAALGGRLRIIVSGGAPLSEDTQEFLKIAFNCRVIQGYGLTETCGSGTSGRLDKYLTRNIGWPSPAVEIKLQDVPEMGYTSNDKPFPRGEILLRGPVVTSGYFKHEDKTKEAYLADGWFSTGDIAQVNKDKTFTIIDRKKSLVKLSFGEYVAVSHLESVYGANCPFVLPNSMFVYGDSYQDHLVAVVVLQPESSRKWAKENGIKFKTMKDLCSNKKLKKTILKDFELEAKKNKLRNFERVRNVHLTDEEWTPENGLLTSSFKLKRNDLSKKFAAEIKSMYQQKAKL